ncbi:MAG: alpha/beta fold hydrolase [Chitinophagales bacterium]|nr:alpha/beta fold hydrolase [Chitinophagales bacterium]
MPLLPSPLIIPPATQPNGHLQTIIPNLRRKVLGVDFVRTRIDTWDNDFLDIDWLKGGYKKIAVITHGLAGNSRAEYVKGIAKVLHGKGYDIAAWNMRGCSGEPNKLLHSFHGGKTDDLHFIIEHLSNFYDYEEVVLVGISMGGNITLKYVGEYADKLPALVKKAFAASVPVDMLGCSLHLIKGWNLIYSRRYLNQYKDMLRLKEKMFPGKFNFKHAYEAADLHQFVDRVTVPMFHFGTIEHYLETQSALKYLDKISIPTLLVNADNDPFLTDTCFPKEHAALSEHFYLEIVHNGGHVGFEEKETVEVNWLEKRILSWFNGF